LVVDLEFRILFRPKNSAVTIPWQENLHRKNLRRKIFAGKSRLSENSSRRSTLIPRQDPGENLPGSRAGRCNFESSPGRAIDRDPNINPITRKIFLDTIAPFDQRNSVDGKQLIQPQVSELLGIPQPIRVTMPNRYASGIFLNQRKCRAVHIVAKNPPRFRHTLHETSLPGTQITNQRNDISGTKGTTKCPTRFIRLAFGSDLARDHVVTKLSPVQRHKIPSSNGPQVSAVHKFQQSTNRETMAQK
jgi:hypothetical protein